MTIKSKMAGLTNKLPTLAAAAVVTALGATAAMAGADATFNTALTSFTGFLEGSGGRIIFDAGADLALGSRNVVGGGVRGWGLGRHLLSKGGSAYSRLGLGVPVKDMTTGFKLYSRRALLTIDPLSLRSNGYAFQIETTARALRRGLRVVEVPIVFVDRRVGQSKMNLGICVEAFGFVLRARAKGALGF